MSKGEQPTPKQAIAFAKKMRAKLKKQEKGEGGESPL
tara:strand:- start:560 stop:670 length:111 start_codon:yes stop_codon:yes gene_type:complete